MKKLSSLLLLTLSLAAFDVMAKGHINLDTAKKAVMQYHDTGEYNQEVTAVINQAENYLKTQLAASAFDGKKPAIVLDIDETSLSNYSNMVKASFGGTLEQMRAAEIEGNDAAIQPTLKLYQFAKSKGVAVFFITGRHEEEQESTVANLKKTGYSNWDGLIFKSAAYKGKSASLFKTAARKTLTEKGYKIILNIGDQKSDLAGGYADKTFQLPNPYYVIP